MIEILRYPTSEDWKRCKLLALNTVSKSNIGEVSDEWKRKILQAEHSPIRTLMFTIRMEIPYYCSVHFSRHFAGVQHYVSSQRNDRQNKYDRASARQDMIVSHIMDINVQALMNISHRRLCYKADATTKKVMEEIVEEISKVSPEIAIFLEPMCKYRRGCYEINPCGYWEKNCYEQNNRDI